MVAAQLPNPQSAPGILNRGLIEVELPSGIRVRGVLPNLQTLLRRGLVPSNLRDVALKAADRRWLVTLDEDPEHQQRKRAYIALEVQAFIREVWDDRTAAWVREEPNVELMDQEDVSALNCLVLRLYTAEQITTINRAVREPQAHQEPEEDPAAIPSWEEFRGEPRSDPPGSDGPPLERAPVPAAGRARRGNRVCARRGAADG